MTWIKKHIDLAVILGTFLSFGIWIDHKFDKIDGRFAVIEKDMAIVKTVLIMKEILPRDLASNAECKP